MLIKGRVRCKVALSISVVQTAVAASCTTMDMTFAFLGQPGTLLLDLFGWYTGQQYLLFCVWYHWSSSGLHALIVQRFATS